MTKSNNRNKLVQFFITYPHANTSVSHPEAETSKEEFIAFLSTFAYKSIFVCEEPHRKSVGNHFHAVLILKRGITHKTVLMRLQGQYTQASQRIDVKACYSPTGCYRYLTQPGYVPSRKRTDPTFVAKITCDLDPEPTLLGSDENLVPKEVFIPFGPAAWHRLVTSCDPAGIMLNRDWHTAMTDPFL